MVALVGYMALKLNCDNGVCWLEDFGWRLLTNAEFLCLDCAVQLNDLFQFKLRLLSFWYHKQVIGNYSEAFEHRCGAQELDSGVLVGIYIY